MRTAKVLILLSCMQAFSSSAALAGSGNVINLPMGTTPKNGLRLDIDTCWVNANGYRPIRVGATNLLAGPSSPDRTIRVELTPRSWRWGDMGPSVSFYIEIPEATKRVQQTVSIPQSDQWRSLQVEVYEDGKRLDDLSVESGIPMGNSRNWINWSEATPAILIIDSDAPPNARRQLGLRQSGPRAKGPADINRLPDIRYLAVLYPNPNNRGNPPRLRLESKTTDDFTLQVLNQMPKIEMLPPSDLPTKWIDYTCFDLTFVTFDDLKSLVRRHPGTWRAIRDWLATGPTLCVFDMPLDSQHLGELEKLLDLPPTSDSRSDVGEFRGWSLPNETRNARDAIRGLDGLYQNARRMRGPDQSPLREILAAAEGITQAVKPVQTPFVSRDVNLGRVFALRTNEPFPRGAYGVSWLLNEIGEENWMWYRRHGMSLHRENRDYWNHMITGVGRAPVTSYLVLISLFVVVIGPVNYLFLRKKKRLYMLLVTVPVGAGLVTFALLSYALISDGLGVRARVRSYAEIDQTAGSAVSWSRQTYYAGLAPSRGLRFPSDAAFFTIEHYPTERHRHRSDRWMVWDEGQRLTSGYLGARSTAQFMVVQSHRSQRGLDILEPNDQESELQVTNNLEAHIAELAICDSAGRYHWAENVETGERFQPQRIEPAKAAKLLRLAYDENRPALPAGFNPRYYRNSFGFGRRWGTDVDQSLAPPSFAQGILERSVQRAIYTDARDMKPRSYVAITRTSAEASLGHQASREEESYHVVSGRW